jgi:hypothetical protein
MAAFLAVPGSQNYLAMRHRAVLYNVLRLRKASVSGAAELGGDER